MLQAFSLFLYSRRHSKTLQRTLHSTAKWSGREEKSYHYGDSQVYFKELVCSLQVLGGRSTHIHVSSQLVSNKNVAQEDSRRSMVWKKIKSKSSQKFWFSCLSMDSGREINQLRSYKQ